MLVLVLSRLQVVDYIVRMFRTVHNLLALAREHIVHMAAHSQPGIGVLGTVHTVVGVGGGADFRTAVVQRLLPRSTAGHGHTSVSPTPRLLWSCSCCIDWVVQPY